MSVNAKQVAATMMDVVRAWVEPAFAAIVGRLEALELRAPAKGEPGRDADPVDETALVTRVLAEIRAPKDGADGKDGTSVTLQDVEPLLARMVAEAVAKIPAGKDGEPGKDGESVHPDTVRAMVVDQVRAEVANIQRPRDGEDGTDGRDATAIDYRDGIDEAKSYPKGTHALYRGGVIVAMRATDPVGDDLTTAGWAVVMNGTHSEAEEVLDDGRTIRRMRILTNGKTVVSEHKTAIVLYRGVWKHDTEYSRGDLATWDGSVWHCEAGTTRARPGSTPDWRLAVKRGNHGKDGKDGERGPAGRDGK